MGALGAIYFAGMVLAIGVVSVVVVLGLLILWAARRAVRAADPDERPSRTARIASTALAIVALAIAATPFAVTILSRAALGADALPSDTETWSLVAGALGALSVAAAWAERDRAARTAVGGLLVAVIVVPAALQLWVASQTLGMADRYRSNVAATEQREKRYADIIDGPSPGEIVAEVGNVGSWTAVSGSLYPFLRSDEWVGDQSPVADLSGRTVRIAILAQCWVEGDRGVLQVYAHDFDVGTLWGTRSGACDGTMQAIVSDPIRLADWPASRLAQARARDRDLIAVSAMAVTVNGTRLPGEYAVRSVAYISADPATPVDFLRDVVASAAGTFDIR